jgi:hypothetical protein
MYLCTTVYLPIAPARAHARAHPRGAGVQRGTGVQMAVKGDDRS